MLQRPKTIQCEKVELLRVASNKSEIIPFDSDNNKLSLDPESDTDDRERRERKSKRHDGWKDGRTDGGAAGLLSAPLVARPSLLQLDLPVCPPSSAAAALPSLPSLLGVTEILQREFSVN